MAESVLGSQQVDDFHLLRAAIEGPHRGVAGQVAYDVTLTYGGGGMTEQETSLAVVGSVYGAPGPVVIVMHGHQHVVVEPSRYGEAFGLEWVRSMYSDADEVRVLS